MNKELLIKKEDIKERIRLASYFSIKEDVLAGIVEKIKVLADKYDLIKENNELGFWDKVSIIKGSLDNDPFKLKYYICDVEEDFKDIKDYKDSILADVYRVYGNKGLIAKYKRVVHNLEEDISEPCFLKGNCSSSDLRDYQSSEGNYSELNVRTFKEYNPKNFQVIFSHTDIKYLEETSVQKNRDVVEIVVYVPVLSNEDKNDYNKLILNNALKNVDLSEEMKKDFIEKTVLRVDYIFPKIKVSELFYEEFIANYYNYKLYERRDEFNWADIKNTIITSSLGNEENIKLVEEFKSYDDGCYDDYEYEEEEDIEITNVEIKGDSKDDNLVEELLEILGTGTENEESKEKEFLKEGECDLGALFGAVLNVLETRCEEVYIKEEEVESDLTENTSKEEKGYQLPCYEVGEISKIINRNDNVCYLKEFNTLYDGEADKSQFKSVILYINKH